MGKHSVVGFATGVHRERETHGESKVIQHVNVTWEAALIRKKERAEVLFAFVTAVALDTKVLKKYFYC